MAGWSHLRTRTNRTNRTPSDCCGAGYTKREIALSTESLIADYALIASSGIVLFQTALPFAITSLPLASTHAALAYIVAAQDWPIASRQEY